MSALVLRITRAVALVAFVAGGAVAIWNTWHSDSVLEFQAGHATTAFERLQARPIYPPGRYNLEPGFPSLALAALNLEYPLNPGSGAMSVSITTPSGATIEMGTRPFKALTTWGGALETETGEAGP